MSGVSRTYLAGFALALLLPLDLYGEGGEPSTLMMGFSDRVFYEVNTQDVRAITKIWAQEVVAKAQEEEWHAETVLFSDMPSIVRALQSGDVDFLTCLPLEYLKISEEAVLKPLWTIVVRGRISYEYVLLVRKDSGVERLEELAGRELVIDIGGRGRIPQIWLDTVLLRSHRPPSEVFFGTVSEASKTSQAILPVFFGQADACLVPLETFETMVDLNPQLHEDLVVLLTSPGFCRGLLCASEDAYDKYANRLRDSVSTLTEGPYGQQLLMAFRVDAIVPFEPAYLDEIRSVLDEYERLKVETGGR